MPIKQPRLNLRQIEVFRTVMLAGSITDAARLLHISQPAVSRLLRHTEDSLGVPLFERIKGRLHPTGAARILYREVERAYESVRHVQDVAQELAGGGAVRIVSGLLLPFVPRAIALWRSQYPEVRIGIDILPHAAIVQRIMTHQADIGLSMLPIEHPSLDVFSLGETGLACLAPRDHPLAGLRVVGPADLVPYPLIAFDRATPQGCAIEEAFGAARAIYDPRIEVGHGQAACALVREGAGVAVVDGFSIADERLSDLVVRPFACQGRLTAKLIADRARPLSAAAEALCSILRDLAGSPAGEFADHAFRHNTELSGED